MGRSWHEFRFRTDAPPEVAFAVLADLTRLPEWDPPVETSTLIDGDGGAGSTWRATTRFGPMSVEVATEILTVDPPTQLEMHVTARYLDEQIRWNVAGTADGSEITLRTNHRFTGPARPMNQLLPIFGRPLQNAALKRLARCIESTATQQGSVDEQ